MVFGILGRKEDYWTLFGEIRFSAQNEGKKAKELRADNLEYELQQLGINLNFVRAFKGKNSVEPGINYVRDLMIMDKLQFDYPAEETYYDHCNYAWKQNARGEPEHEFSHGPDMVRYGLVSWLIYSGDPELYF
jgi:hypothetical protein